jgi:hypothetical protein
MDTIISMKKCRLFEPVEAHEGCAHCVDMLEKVKNEVIKRKRIDS